MKRIIFAVVLAAAMLFMGLYMLIAKCRQLFSGKKAKEGAEGEQDSPEGITCAQSFYVR